MYLKVDGASRLQIKVGKFQIAQQKLLRCDTEIKFFFETNSKANYIYYAETKQKKNKKDRYGIIIFV
jgi:hypothetical protein